METSKGKSKWPVPICTNCYNIFNERTNYTNLWRNHNLRLWGSVFDSCHAIYTVLCSNDIGMGSSAFEIKKTLSRALFLTEIRNISSRMFLHFAWRPFTFSIILTSLTCCLLYSNRSSERNCGRESVLDLNIQFSFHSMVWFFFRFSSMAKTPNRWRSMWDRKRYHQNMEVHWMCLNYKANF